MPRHGARPGRFPQRHRCKLQHAVRLASVPRAPARRSARRVPIAAPGGEVVAMAWEVVVGIETHTQLLTRSKMFSSASTAFGAPPNTHASAVDIALPGT